MVFKSLLKRMVVRLRDEDGSMSIEFILTFPLLALWLMGSFVWFDAYRSNSQTAKVAYTMSDMASRYNSVDETDMAEIFAVHKTLLPNRVAEGYVRVSSICWNGDEHRVVWSYVGDDTYAAAKAAYEADPDNNPIPRLVPLTDAEIPVNLMPTMSVNDSIILTDVYGRWVPLADWVGLSETTWTNRLVTRPRFVTMIPYEGSGMTDYADRAASLCPVVAEEEPTPSETGEGGEPDGGTDQLVAGN